MFNRVLFFIWLVLTHVIVCKAHGLLNNTWSFVSLCAQYLFCVWLDVILRHFTLNPPNPLNHLLVKTKAASWHLQMWKLLERSVLCILYHTAFEHTVYTIYLCSKQYGVFLFFFFFLFFLECIRTLSRLENVLFHYCICPFLW